MIGLNKLTKKQIEVLRQMVLFTCQSCGKTEEEVGTLEPHRLVRGNVSGKYCPNNIQMCCNRCHKNIHANEFTHIKGK